MHISNNFRQLRSRVADDDGRGTRNCHGQAMGGGGERDRSWAHMEKGTENVKCCCTISISHHHPPEKCRLPPGIFLQSEACFFPVPLSPLLSFQHISGSSSILALLPSPATTTTITGGEKSCAGATEGGKGAVVPFSFFLCPFPGNQRSRF